jgi:tRNA(Ile)-lysidine synthase
MGEINSALTFATDLWHHQPVELFNPMEIDFCLAFSGGLDSAVLLSVLHMWRSQGWIAHCRAIHVNHGLSPNAKTWEEFCQGVCVDHAIPLKIARIKSIPAVGESVEAWARAQRLTIFSQHMQSNTVLLTAHQQTDQAETVLLNLFRGSGIAGLSAMPIWQSFGAGFHWRPLLNVQRPVLAEYAKIQQIKFVEDESNASPRFERNYLRHHLMPHVHQRWPSATRLLSRAAKHCAESLELMHDLAQQDLALCLPHENHFSIHPWKTLSSARRRNVILYFLKTLGLLTPDEKKLYELERQLLTAKPPLKLAIRWKNNWARAYRERIYFMVQTFEIEQDYEQVWDGVSTLQLPGGLGYLQAILSSAIPNEFVVRFRRPGDFMYIPGRGTHTLKNIFQEAGIPPWQRSRIPLVLWHETIIQIPGVIELPDLVASAISQKV